MNAFKCPFGNSGFPRYMHDTGKSGVALKLVWTECEPPRDSAVADVLSAAGFPDFGKELTLLVTQMAETISREGTSSHLSLYLQCRSVIILTAACDGSE